jgi:hypothetical protein
MLHSIGNKLIFILKTTLKNYLGPIRYRKLYIRYYIFISAYYIMTNSINRVLFRRIFVHDKKPNQKYISWNTNLPFFYDYQSFIEYLENNQIHFYLGGCTLYIPPQSALDKHFGEMMAFYPPDAGLKILKDFSPPERANYLKYNKEVSWQEVKLVSDTSALLDVACTLEDLGLGARVYDLVRLIAHQTQMTCFVVRHIPTQDVTGEDVKKFLRLLDAKSLKSILATVVPYKDNPHSDFQPPNCNSNLVKDQQGSLFYIDFQQFGLLDPTRLPTQIVTSESGKLSFGDVNFLRSNRPYLYQTIPSIRIAARRDTALRWQTIKNLLASKNITVDKRLILDICCNSGMMLSMPLTEGALWGLGWDLPEIAEAALQLQRALGFSRVDLIKASLSPNYSLLADIEQRFSSYLNECIVFYLAAYDHIGLIAELAEIPWRVLFFEGHETINKDNYINVTNFMVEGCRSQLVKDIDIRDGDSQTRHLYMFMR